MFDISEAKQCYDNDAIGGKESFSPTIPPSELYDLFSFKPTGSITATIAGVYNSILIV